MIYEFWITLESTPEAQTNADPRPLKRFSPQIGPLISNPRPDQQKYLDPKQDWYAYPSQAQAPLQVQMWLHRVPALDGTRTQCGRTWTWKGAWERWGNVILAIRYWVPFVFCCIFLPLWEYSLTEMMSDSANKRVISAAPIDVEIW